MADGDHARYRVNFEIEGLDDLDLFRVIEMSGRDELSQLFDFHLVVEHRDGVPFLEEDYSAIFGSTAVLSFGEDREHPMFGVVRAVELVHHADPAIIRYRMRFVPKLFDATYTRGSWVFLDMGPGELIAGALDAETFTEGEDFETNLESDWYPAYEYTLQYEETDFNFIARKAEHHGIFFFHDHLGEKAKVVFADTNNAFAELEGHEQVRYQTVVGVVDDAETITEFWTRRTQGPKTMIVREYNDHIPSVDLTREIEIDPNGVGTVNEWGNHYLTPSEAGAMVQVRAEEINASASRFFARSRVRGLRPGHRFEFVGHPLGFDRSVFVVSVEHHYGDGSRDDGDGYWNQLVLQSLDVAYRPPRVTPKPVVSGVIPAKIDSERQDDGVNTPIDEWGRYKVLLPFRVNGESGGKASCWVRMASASAGAGYGMNLPLHEGTEVAVYHINGDPDRPIIAGSVPNTETASPVNSSNPHESQIRTRGGITIRMGDG